LLRRPTILSNTAGLGFCCCSNDRQSRYAQNVRNVSNPVYGSGAVPQEAQMTTMSSLKSSGQAAAVALHNNIMYQSADQQTEANTYGIQGTATYEVTQETELVGRACLNNAVYDTGVPSTATTTVSNDGSTNNIYNVNNAVYSAETTAPSLTNSASINYATPTDEPPEGGAAAVDPADSGYAPPLLPASVGRAPTDPNNHGAIDRAMAEQRLKTAGAFRYLLREKSGGGGGKGLVFGTSVVHEDAIGSHICWLDPLARWMDGGCLLLT
jgi:hypothetical protein